MLFTSHASRRLRLFASASAIGLLSAGLFANDPAVACAPLAPVDGDTVTCGDAAYGAGIAYSGIEDLTVVVNPAGPITAISEGADAGIALVTGDPGNDGTLSVIIQSDAGEAVTISTTSDATEGVKVFSINDNVYIRSDATVVTTGNSTGSLPEQRSIGLLGFSRNGNSVVINDGSVSTYGTGAVALWSEGFDRAVAVNYGSIYSQQSTGILVEGEVGSYAYNYGDITVTGANARGIFVYGSEDDQPGAERMVAVNNGSIVASGSDNIGIYIYAAIGDALLVNNDSVVTSGANSEGLLVFGTSPGIPTEDGNPAFTIQNNGTVATSGTNADGIWGYSLNGSITVGNTGAVETTGAGSHGVYARSEGTATILINNIEGEVRATGDGSFGVVVNTTTGNVGTVNNSGLVHGGSGSGGAIGATSNTALVITNFAGGVLSAESERFLALANLADSFTNGGDAYGFFELGDGDDDFLNAGGGRVFLTQISDAGDGTDEIDNFGTFFVDGIAMEAPEIQGLEVFRNFGSIVMSDTAVGGLTGVAGDTLSISGDFVSEGGSLFLDTFLGDDSSPSDVLILEDALDGSAPTRIFVTNTTGPGALTTGNGILVVDTDTSESNVFTLGAPVYAGVYEYFLAQEEEDWFLQSRVAPQNEEYAAIGLQQMGFWYETLLPLHTRMGELRLQTADPNRYQSVPRNGGQTASLGGTDLAVRPGAGDRSPYGVWGRAIGGSFDVSAGNLNWDQEIYGAQFAADVGIEEAVVDDDVLVLGVMAGLAGGRADFGMGSQASFDDYNLSLYANYFTQGYWATAVVKLDYLDVDWNSPILPETRETDGWSAGALLEIGYTHVDPGGGWFLEPQAEIAYITSSLGDLDTGTGQDVAFDDVESLRGRVGLRGGGIYEVGDNGRFSPYLQAHLLHEFLAESQASVAGVAYDADMTGTGYEVGAGVHAADLSSNVSVFVDVVYRGGDNLSGVRALGGLRFSW